MVLANYNNLQPKSCLTGVNGLKEVCRLCRFWFCLSLSATELYGKSKKTVWILIRVIILRHRFLLWLLIKYILLFCLG